jgi:hypothetical protein
MKKKKKQGIKVSVTYKKQENDAHKKVRKYKQLNP